MTLDKLHAEWAVDSELDLSQPDKELRKIPTLHSKWWNIYTNEKQRYLMIKQDYDVLRLAKFDWLLGRMDEAERERRGWPVQHLRLVRTEIDAYLVGDAELAAAKTKLEMQNTKLDFIEDIIKTIGNRGFSIKTYVEYLKFSQGSM